VCSNRSPSNRLQAGSPEWVGLSGNYITGLLKVEEGFWSSTLTLNRVKTRHYTQWFIKWEGPIGFLMAFEDKCESNFERRSR